MHCKLYKKLFFKSTWLKEGIMRSFSAFLVLFFLVSFAYRIDARRCPGDYWKSMMKNEPIPQVISDLFHQGTASEPCEKETSDTDSFVGDFDIRPNVILYHSDADSKRVKPHADGVKLIHTDNVDSSQNVPEQNNA